MTHKAELQTWAVTLDTDSETNTAQRLTIPSNLWDKGWLRNNPVGAQHLNQLLYLLSGAIKDETLEPALNLSDVPDPAVARTNLDLLTKSSNLSDVPNAATARTNLDTFTKASNLSDVVDKSAARTNLDLYTKASNLSDIPSASSARTNLGVNTLTEIQDAVINTIYPIGSIYTITGVATNPATILGVGTWVAFGEGRVLVGVGTGSVDANGDSLTIADAGTGGEVNHTLTEAEMPSHTHTLPSNASDTTSDNFVADSDGAGTARTAITGSTGGDTAHNNISPFLGVYLWKRVS